MKVLNFIGMVLLSAGLYLTSAEIEEIVLQNGLLNYNGCEDVHFDQELSSANNSEELELKIRYEKEGT